LGLCSNKKEASAKERTAARSQWDAQSMNSGILAGYSGDQMENIGEVNTDCTSKDNVLGIEGRAVSVLNIEGEKLDSVMEETLQLAEYIIPTAKSPEGKRIGR
jgi:hypothetical protein